MRVLLSVLVSWSALSVHAEPPSAVMPEKHREFFKSNCLDCHNAEEQEGKVRLDDLPFEITDIATAERWQKVLNALNSGEMPPEDEKQPSNDEKTLFLDHLSNVMVSARKRLTDQGGVITMRRLNRREYENTIRDLLGVQVNTKSLPTDTGAGGFDTVGSSLFFSSDQFEQYLAIARTALAEAMWAGEQPQMMKQHRECERVVTPILTKALTRMLTKRKECEQAIAENNPTKYGFVDVARAKFELAGAERNIPIHEKVLAHPLSKTGALLTLHAGYAKDVTTISADAPPGEYLLRVRMAVLPGVPDHRHYIEIGQSGEDSGAAQGEMTVLGCYKVTGSPEKPQTIEIPITVTRSGSRSFIVRERQHNDRLAVKQTFFASQRINGVGPELSLWLDCVDYEGPIIHEWPPLPYQRLFSDLPLDDKHAREIVDRFAMRAFRGRSVEPEFLDKLMKIYEAERQDGVEFLAAIIEPLAIVLASPSFLYIVEPSKESQATRELTSIELANRLSYFLWSSPPDDELLALGRSGALSQPEVLARQVDRLIADSKAQRFVNGFVSQWLHMERLDFFQFNPQLYPAFDHSARLAARDEVFHTFLTVLRDGLALGELLKADFVVVNDLLADYYGIPGVRGSQFRCVSVPAGLPRGGMLGMAAILAMGSDGERSSPVERGAFVLRRLLNAPPPPAPANVPQLSRLAGQALPARALLAAHMEEPQCAQCHRKIDPIGYGLENFDAAGLWRAEELVPSLKGTNKKTKGKPKAFPIDPAGQLPDGTGFTDFFGLRDAIATRENAFTRGLTEALIEFALGRPFGFADEELASKLVGESKQKDYQLRDIIHRLVASEAFQRK